MLPKNLLTLNWLISWVDWEASIYQSLNHPKMFMITIAWATKHKSNGLIVQWSRWHKVYNTQYGAVTLCGIGLPPAKLIHGGKDGRISGGRCHACIAANKALYPKI